MNADRPSCRMKMWFNCIVPAKPAGRIELSAAAHPEGSPYRLNESPAWFDCAKNFCAAASI